MPLPLQLLILLEDWERTKHTAALTLNVKEGRVVSFDVTEKTRLDIHR